MMKTTTSMSFREWALLAGLSFLWGGSFLFNGIAVRHLPPMFIVVARVTIATIVLNAIVLFSRRGVTEMVRHWRMFVVMGLLNNVIPFSLIVGAQTQISSGLASVLNATTPLFSAIVAHLYRRDERLNAHRIAGILFGILGVLVVMGLRTLRSGADSAVSPTLVIGASVSYAFAGVFGRRFGRLGISPLHTAAGQVTASTIVLVPIILVLACFQPVSMPPMEAWLALAGLGVISTALAYLLYFRLLRTAGATNTLIVTMLIPVSATLLGVTILGEAISANQVTGFALILCGLAILDGRLLVLLRDFSIRRRRQPDAKKDAT